MIIIALDNIDNDVLMMLATIYYIKLTVCIFVYIVAYYLRKLLVLVVVAVAAAVLHLLISFALLMALNAFGLH